MRAKFLISMLALIALSTHCTVRTFISFGSRKFIGVGAFYLEPRVEMQDACHVQGKDPIFKPSK